MKHELIITTLLATTLTVSAQEEGRNMAAIGFGASHDSWNIELDYDYMVFPYAGIGIGAQFDRENGDGGLLGEIIREELRGDDYYDDYDDEHEIKLNIVPPISEWSKINPTSKQRNERVSLSTLYYNNKGVATGPLLIVCSQEYTINFTRGKAGYSFFSRTRVL